MLFRKMLRDFRGHAGQFLSIIILTFIAMSFFSGVASEVEGVEAARTRFESEAELGNGWIFGDDFTSGDLGKLNEIHGISNAQGRRYEEIHGSDDTLLYLYFQHADLINRPLVLEGEAYDPGDSEGIWLSARFAAEQGIHVGDDYSVSAEGKELRLRVKGLIWQPEYEYYKNEVDLEPDYHDTGYAFASMKVLPEGTAFNQIVFRSDAEKVSMLEKDIRGVLGDRYNVLLDRSGITNLTMLDDEIRQHRMMSVMFPAFFAVIAILTTVTTMSRIVDRQRTQIGTMKALGLKERKIYMHYLGYGLVPSLIGTLLGLIVGPVSLSPDLFAMKFYMDSSTEYMLPEFPLVIPWYFPVFGALMVLACVTATWLSCRKILAIRPAQALRPAQPKSAKKMLLERMYFWKKLSFTTRYNLRDVSRNKVRTLFGIAGTFSCMALLLCAFASRADFKGAIEDLYVNKLMNNSAMITLEKDTDIRESERLRDMVNGELVMSDTVELRTPESADRRTFHMNVYEDGRICNVLDLDFRTSKIGSEDFTLTYKAAESLGVSVGDTVEWHIYGSAGWKTSRVTAITRAPFEQGIVAGRKAVEAAGYSFTPTRLLTQEDVTEALKAESPYIADVTTREGLSSALDHYMELVNMVMAFMLVFALLLVFVVLYSLGLLSFEEREKEIATLKVLGLSSRSLGRLMLQQNIYVALIGALLGIPLGKMMLSALVNSLGDSMDIPTKCSPGYIVLAFAITFTVSVMINQLFSGRIRKLNLVEEIKAAE